jgi:hypothetical protein
MPEDRQNSARKPRAGFDSWNSHGAPGQQRSGQPLTAERAIGHDGHQQAGEQDRDERVRQGDSSGPSLRSKAFRPENLLWLAGTAIVARS